MKKANVQSLFSFAGNILDKSKKFIEESIIELSENNEDCQQLPKDDSVLIGNHRVKSYDNSYQYKSDQTINTHNRNKFHDVHAQTVIQSNNNNIQTNINEHAHNNIKNCLKYSNNIIVNIDSFIKLTLNKIDNDLTNDNNYCNDNREFTKITECGKIEIFYALVEFDNIISDNYRILYSVKSRIKNVNNLNLTTNINLIPNNTDNLTNNNNYSNNLNNFNTPIIADSLTNINTNNLINNNINTNITEQLANINPNNLTNTIINTKINDNIPNNFNDNLNNNNINPIINENERTNSNDNLINSSTNAMITDNKRTINSNISTHTNIPDNLPNNKNDNLIKTTMINESNPTKADEINTKLQEALDKIIKQNKSLEDSKTDLLIKYELLLSEHAQTKTQLNLLINDKTSLNNEISNLNTIIKQKESEYDRIVTQFNEFQKTRACADQTSDLQRLRTHLVEIEERYACQIKELEDEKRKSENMLQNMSVELNRTKTNVTESRNKYERHLRSLTEQLNHISLERDDYMSQVVKLSACADNQKTTIEYLNETLVDLQRDHESQINLITDAHEYNISQLKQSFVTEKQKVLDELCERLSNEHACNINTYKSKINELERQIIELNNKISLINANCTNITDNNTKNNSDMILVKNLVIAYSKLGDQHKNFGWRVLCGVLNITEKDVDFSRKTASSLSWIPIINRFVGKNEDLTKNGPSLSEMFVEYLEEESKKISVMNPPYIPPISTDELVDLVNRHHNSSSL